MSTASDTFIKTYVVRSISQYISTADINITFSDINLYIDPAYDHDFSSQNKNKLGVAVIIVPNILIILSGGLVFVDFTAIENIKQDPISISKPLSGNIRDRKTYKNQEATSKLRITVCPRW